MEGEEGVRMRVLVRKIGLYARWILAGKSVARWEGVTAVGVGW